MVNIEAPWALIAGDGGVQKPTVGAVRLPEGDLATHRDVREIRLGRGLAGARLFADGVQVFHSPVALDKAGAGPHLKPNLSLSPSLLTSGRPRWCSGTARGASSQTRRSPPLARLHLGLRCARGSKRQLHSSALRRIL